MVNYYPNITLELLRETLNWAKTIVEITVEAIEIILKTKKSLLYFNGGFDSAEVCDLVGLFLLSELSKQKLNADTGIFCDDGLGVSSATPRQIEQIKKKIC